MEPGSGPYAPGSTVLISQAIDIGGQPGAPVPTVTANPGAEGIRLNAGHIHDVFITQAGSGANALTISTASAERVTVNATGSGDDACAVQLGTITDSVCSAAGGGLGIDALETSKLRNVVASGSYGLYVQAGGVINNHLDAINVIAKGSSFPDVYVAQTGSGVASATLTNSNYATKGTNGGATVTPEGTNGNQTAAPLLSADFHELAGSPTIDAGLAAADLGLLDLGRTPRSQAICLGGVVKPDIGAYEFAPTSPPQPACSLFTIGKLKLNKKKGTGELHITVPGSGSLKASAKGMKKASANATAAGDIKLKLKASGKSKRKLADKGKLKVKVKLAWTPTGGAATTQTKKVKLKKK
jgi:hypothetical protein